MKFRPGKVLNLSEGNKHYTLEYLFDYNAQQWVLMTCRGYINENKEDIRSLGPLGLGPMACSGPDQSGCKIPCQEKLPLDTKFDEDCWITGDDYGSSVWEIGVNVDSELYAQVLERFRERRRKDDSGLWLRDIFSGCIDEGMNEYLNRETIPKLPKWLLEYNNC